MSVDYKNTVFLPKTGFSMRGNLTEKEPQLLNSWKQKGLFRAMEELRADCPKFVLHDGPPYANGNIHIGHGLNKILKDIINRIKHMQGYNVKFRPGWDCHGLPIEWQIEEKYRKQGQNKDEVPLIQFRQECREFAAQWIEVQKQEFQRLGIFANWDNPYITMDYSAEAKIVEKLGNFLTSGRLYKGEKPVMWSVIEKTALAEAEIEYKEVTSISVYVAFPVVRSAEALLQNAEVVIWTTTPWTLPANRAICYGDQIDYVVVEVLEGNESSLLNAGNRYVVSKDLCERFAQSVGLSHYHIVGELKGEQCLDTICAHPLHASGYSFDVPMLHGDHVTTESGTGLVHTAPGHGEEDFLIGKKHELEIPRTVAADGTYYEHVPLFAGQHVFKVAEAICNALQEANSLLAKRDYVHSYPHSWRSKSPLIFLVTPQWFISMEVHDLRQKMLTEIDRIDWYPKQSKRRIQSMVETCPDWCVSRQRAWGTPITIFVHKATGKPLVDPDVLGRIVEAVRQEGGDTWFTSDPKRFLGKQYDVQDYEQVQDILDVWFDSGCSYAFALDDAGVSANTKSCADLYLEGSDQHRGWFQSSLKVGCGTSGSSPYKAVLTHGFVLDENGHKMSKSIGNTVAPMKIADTVGIEILRLWVVGSDYSQDLRIGSSLLVRQQDVYRRFRNTLRYLLGALTDFTESEKLPYDQLPELERWVLHQVYKLNQHVQNCINKYELQSMYNAIHNFCSTDLSAYYFDIRKDVLYCDAVDSLKRRAVRTVFNDLFENLCTWLAPVLCFTAEEAWLERFGEKAQSVHLSSFLPMPEEWHAAELEERYMQIFQCRRLITGALEKARTEGLIGSSLQAKISVYSLDAIVPSNVAWDELSIVSQVAIHSGSVPDNAFTSDEAVGMGVVVAKAEGDKCERCWKVLPEVGVYALPSTCKRCNDVVSLSLGSE